MNATFRVNMSVSIPSYFVFQSIHFNVPVPANKAALGRGSESDINFGFRPEDNRHLIVHEYSGLEPGDAHGLQTVRDFIINRMDPNCAPAKRLHVIW